MDYEKEQIEGARLLQLGVVADAYRLIDNIYSLIAHSDMYNADALNLAYNTISAELSKGSIDEESRYLLQHIANYLHEKRGR